MSINDPFDNPFGDVEVQLGPRGEELRELLRRPFETDEIRKAELEVLMEMAALLGDVAENTGGTTRSTQIIRVGESDSEVGVAEGTEPGQTTETPARYYSTGEGGVTVDETEWDAIDFGFAASEVNIRHDDDVDVALSNPTEYDDAIVPLFGDSSVTIGGYEGLGATRLHYRQGSGATGAPTIHVLAQ
jgi:hypothetical protein